jgi:hypothetical protein
MGVPRHASWPVLVAVIVAAIHAAFLFVPLHTDEAGLALVGRGMLTAHDAGRSLYGDLWIDRPPPLVFLYGAAQLLGGAVGVRVLGLVAAGGRGFVTARIAMHLAGRRAAAYASIVAGAFAASPALGASLAYPELLAAPVVATSVLLVLGAACGRQVSWQRWLVAGLLASLALLLKQSFLDGIVAVVALAAATRVSWNRLAALGVGLAVPVLASFGWAWLDGAGVGRLAYALLGFRIDGFRALATANAPFSHRVTQLGITAMAAGLPLLLPLGVAGVKLLHDRFGRPATVLFVSWLGGAAFGVLGGGYYWPHYMIQLTAVLGVLAAVTLDAAPTGVRRVLAAGLVGWVAAVGGAAWWGGHLGLTQQNARRVADVVSDNRRPHDTIFVMYAKVNVVYYTGVRPAFPYQWSLMYRTIPSLDGDVGRMLQSPERPTWIVEWNQPGSYGMDTDGHIAQDLTRYYRPVSTTCGRPVLLRRDDPRPLQVPLQHCDA